MPGATAPSRQQANANSGVMPTSEFNRALTEVGVDKNTYDIYRQSVASIESGEKGYAAMGGAGNAYDGAYQMGEDAKIDAANILGIKVPTREEFRKNPQLQEQMFDAYTYANHTYLMKNKIYENMQPEDKMAVLAFAHNQGWGAASNWLNTKTDPTRDKFGTSGTKFFNTFNENMQKGSANPGHVGSLAEGTSPGAPTKLDQNNIETNGILSTAQKYIGLSETDNTEELSKLTKVDPKETSWCGAFTGAVLKESGYDAPENTNLAKNFLKYGQPVATPDAKPGDIAVFNRGGEKWQGHVGIVQSVDGDDISILGGNQDNKVSVVKRNIHQPGGELVGIRRPGPRNVVDPEKVAATKNNGGINPQAIKDAAEAPIIVDTKQSTPTNVTAEQSTPTIEPENPNITPDMVPATPKEIPEEIAEQPETPPKPPKQTTGTRITQTTPTDHTNNNNIASPFDKELFTHLLNRVAEIYG